MTFKEALKEIESHAFAARLGVASDLKTFLRAAWNQVELIVLLNELRNEDIQRLLLLRAINLSQEKVDPRFENPSDTALALYVWAAYMKNNDLGKILAQAVTRAPQCWWAKLISRQIILDNPVFNNENQNEEGSIIQPQASKETNKNYLAGEKIINADFPMNVFWIRKPLKALKQDQVHSGWGTVWMRPQGFSQPDVSSVSSL